MEETETKSFQHFKFTLPILKTRTLVVKDENGNDVEKKYVAGNSSSTDLDLHGDRMDPSAIKSMADSLHYHIIKLNAEHDTSWQSELGDVTDLTVTDNNELYMEAELNVMSKSQDLWYALTTLNKKLGLSIGGYVKEYEMVKEEFKNEESGEVETKWVKHYKNIQLDHIAVTSSPANPKTWVGAIAKSIQEDSAMLAKKLELEERYKNTDEEETQKNVEAEETTLSSKKERDLKEVARSIVKMVQTMEADLLLELTYSGLHILSDNQISILSKLFIAERGAEMKKDISLEAEEAIKADTEAKPEGDVVETPATLENESKEEAPAAEVETEEPAKAEEPAPAEEAPKAEEAPATEVAEEKPAEEKPAEAEEESEESSGVEEGKTEEPTAPAESEPVKPAEEEESADKTEDKSVTEGAELLKSIQDLTGKMTEVLKTNETLSKRIQELEAQPASRKTVELEKGVGDDDTQPIDTKGLKAEMEEKIAQVRKDNYGSPNLFAMVQKIRAEYSRKIQEQN